MARPITWQDVVAPNQAGNLQAAQIAANQITAALSGLGDVGMAARKMARDEATRQAIATIQNSADPLAAAEQVQGGWQIDPLAVSRAAQNQLDTLNQRDVQRRQGLAADASRAAAELQRELTKYNLEGAELADQAAAVAQPFLNQLRLTGKDPLPTFTADRLGVMAQNLYEQGRAAFFREQREREQLALQRDAARGRKQDEDFLRSIREAALTNPELQGDPAALSRFINEQARKFNASYAATEAAAGAFEAGVRAFVPTQEELSREALPGSDNNPPLTFEEVANIVDQRKADVEAHLHEFMNSPLDPKKKYSITPQNLLDAARPSQFSGNKTTIQLQLADVLGMDLDDVQRRYRYAETTYPHLRPEQLAEIVVATQDSRLFQNNPANDTPGKMLAMAFEQVNKLGGPKGVAKHVQQLAKPYLDEADKVDKAFRELNGAILGGKPLPDSAAEIIKGYQEAEAARANQPPPDDEEARRKRIREELNLSGLIYLSG